MPQVSKKGQAMPASPIRRLVPYSDAAKARGIKVYHLNIGQPDIETPRFALEALNDYRWKVLAYTHSAGEASTRRKMTEYYKKWGIDVTEDEIILTNGGSEAIQFAFGVCLDAGDEVIIPEPFYANYNGFATESDVVVKPIMSFIHRGFALPSIEEFEKVITNKTKAIMICNPNNPTGAVYSEEELHQLADLVKKYDLFLFVDEVYREFAYDGKYVFPSLNLGIDDHVIMFDSVSKRYSACGARLGMFVSKNKEVMKAAMKYAQARLCPSAFSQVFAEAAVDTPEEYFAEVKNEYLARRNCVVVGVNAIPGCFCPTPRGAFYAVARLPIDDSDAFCKWLLEEFNYNGETVMLAPATGFYSVEGMGKDEVRISYCLKVEDLQAALKCLEEALKVYPGRMHF
ncbi:MAG: pyridoxal phosphate-dependent aminotransferase [Bacteroidales bacterium]|nr:pyridoxal phosphate-dependent aminotransferase [Bacteroidales bacterium]